MDNSRIEDERNLPVVIVDTHWHVQLDRERDETYLLQAFNNEKSSKQEDSKMKMR